MRQGCLHDGTFVNDIVGVQFLSLDVCKREGPEADGYVDEEAMIRHVPSDTDAVPLV